MDVDEASLPPDARRSPSTSRRRAASGSTVTATTDLARRPRRRRVRHHRPSRSVGSPAWSTTSRSPPATASASRSATASGPAASPARCAASRSCSTSPARSSGSAPDALLLNVSNPLTALCRAVTSQTAVRTVGLCNELVGLQFWLSLVFDADMRAHRPGRRRRQPLPARDRAAHRRRATGSPCCATCSTIPSSSRASRCGWRRPPASHWHKLDPGAGLDQGRHRGRQPGQARAVPTLRRAARGRRTPTSPSSSPGSSRPRRIRAGRGASTTTASPATARTRPTTTCARPSWRPEVTSRRGRRASWSPRSSTPSSPARRATSPSTCPTRGQVEGLARRCGGRVHGGRSTRAAYAPATSPRRGALTEHLRRVVASQELTVEAALTGDRGTVVEAMLADPVAGSLPWEHVRGDDRRAACRDGAVAVAGVTVHPNTP